ncbi:MAG: efflux RND transporter periplasmic adaptor subunit, partial [Deltaproteobacteria bacterium]
ALACSRAPAASYKSEPVTRGPIAAVVSATGEVSAVTTVSIGSQVSGMISRLYVDFNSKVKQGQVLADLDPRLFEVAHQRALAGLYAAESDREKARLALADTTRAEKRTRELFERSLVARADLETAVSAREGAEAALRGAEARVLQARADRDAAATSVALCRIRSPIDGIVISRNVDVGQTVAASLQAPTLFVIANDLSRMQVLANVDEADVGRVKEGLAARFTVDAFPGEVFHGRIREVRQAPASIQNVVTYAAVVDAPNPDGKLRQGMTASVTMVTSQRSSALRVANAALRYHPSQDAAASTKVARNQVPLVSEAWADTAPEPEGETRPGTRRVFAWKLQSGRPVRVPVVTGISDGQRTEVISGLAEGDQVVLADSVAPNGGKHGPF